MSRVQWSEYGTYPHVCANCKRQRVPGPHDYCRSCRPFNFGKTYENYIKNHNQKLADAQEIIHGKKREDSKF